MIGIKHISCYLPESRIKNCARLEEFEINNTFLEKKLGMVELSRKAENQETSDLCIEALKKLISESDIEPLDIECLIVCTQNGDGYGLPHTSAIVHAKANLSENCAVFDISLGCSGYIYSLSVIKAFMESNNFCKGILITADPYSKIIDSQDKNTAPLFGDAATATLLTDQPEWEIGHFCFGSNGKKHLAIHTNPQRQLSMNGRDVFSFCATKIPENITKTLKRNKLSINDIDHFALHQGSRYILDTIVKRTKIPPEKAPFYATHYGNTISSSIPIILSNLAKYENNVLISGFGVGLSWGSTVLSKKSQNEI